MTTTAHLEQVLPAESALATAAVAATVLASDPPTRTVLSARLLGGCWVTIDRRRSRSPRAVARGRCSRSWWIAGRDRSLATS